MYKVPPGEVLSDTEEKAVAGLLVCKKLLLDPKDLLKHRIHVTQVKQGSGELLMAQGDVVHFGVATEPPPNLQGGTLIRSRNVAINFLPVRWLTTGLPRLVEWMHWLRDSCLPVQSSGLQSTGTQLLHTAVIDDDTNYLVASTPPTAGPPHSSPSCSSCSAPPGTNEHSSLPLTTPR